MCETFTNFQQEKFCLSALVLSFSCVQYNEDFCKDFGVSGMENWFYSHVSQMNLKTK